MSDEVLAVTTRRPSTVRTVAASPLYRGATISLFLSGLGTSAIAPQIALFLVKVLGASLPTAGLFYLTNLTAPLAGYLIGSRSDRSGDRLGLFRICSVVGALGWAAVALSTHVWMPFVISAVVLGFAGGAGSQLFAAVRDELAADPATADDGVVSTIRMALTAGWVVGPFLGSWCASQFGLRTALFGTAVCGLAQIIPLGFARATPRTAPTTDQPRPDRTQRLRPLVPLLTFTALYILVYAGESLKYAFLPIYMTNTLHLSPSLRGAVIGIQPLVELALMPIAVFLMRQFGAMYLLVLSAVFGLSANIIFATCHNTAGMFGGQLLMGGVWGIFAALGIIVAQHLYPSRVATASAIFLSSTAISSALGGLTGSLGVAILGLPHVFYIPGTLAGIAAVGLVIMAHNTGRIPARN
jgi:SET family sugar efflux transporter-like MFS transporter